jgi:hypothetical protein
VGPTQAPGARGPEVVLPLHKVQVGGRGAAERRGARARARARTQQWLQQVEVVLVLRGVPRGQAYRQHGPTRG